MKKKYFVFLLCKMAILFFSCKSSQVKKNQKMGFAFSETYRLDSDEVEFTLSEEVVMAYEHFQNFDDFNLPLNKYVEGKNHYVFFSAAIENNVEEVLQKLIEEDKKSNLISDKKQKKFTQLFLKQNGIFAVKLIYKEKVQAMPIVVSMLSKDSTLIKNVYDSNKLLSKIN